MLRRLRIKNTVPPRSYAEISGPALRGNYQALRDLAGGQEVLPMVKADAYGHGAIWVGEELSRQPGLYGLGVATLEEGLTLREGMGPRASSTPILVFSGATPWSEEKGQLCEQSHLIPVLCRHEDWVAFYKQGWPGRIPYELKFNTGMNRLGIHPDKATAVLKDLKTLPADARPQGILSHLAVAEDPAAPISRRQLERFKAIRGLFAPHLTSTRFHLANSAGLWNFRAWQLADLTDAVRPGLSLYGVVPWKGAPLRGIEPVMTLNSQIMCIHQLKVGESVGYGAKFTVTRDNQCPRRIATLAAGYADGIHRTLSERGHVSLSGHREQVIGTVSMDLSAISCSASAKVGQYATWIGTGIDLWAQAQAAGTVPYELLTSVSGRVQRVYV